MSGINGFLNLGTALSGSVVTPPPSGAGYAPQYVSFDQAVGGVTLNGVSCTFGPVTAPWGTLTSFNVTDSSGNPYFAGTLQSPFTPIVGQIVTVPQGNISLAVGSQFNAGPASSLDAILFADQFASLQAAHDALPATGGMIVLPDGVTVIDSQINISKDNVTLFGRSWSTVLQRKSTYSTGRILNITGNNCTLDGFAVDGNSVVQLTYFEISCFGVNCLVQRLKIINSAGPGHLALGGAGCRATSNLITGLGTSLSTERGYGIWAINGVQTQIDSNTITGTCIDAIGVNGAGTLVDSNQVSGCHCWTGGQGGQIATYHNANPELTSGIIVSNNFVGAGGGAFASGIELDADDTICCHNAIQYQASYGILVIAGGVNVKLIGNFIRNCCQSVANSDAILINSNSTGISVIGNTVVDDQTPATLRYALALATGVDQITITDNDLTTVGTGPFLDNSSATAKVMRNNIGIDNVIGTIASGSSITLTPNPIISMTGSATVTTVSSGLRAQGRQFTLLPTGAAVLTTGGNIANTVTCVANVPVIGTFSGSLYYFK